MLVLLGGFVTADYLPLQGDVYDAGVAIASGNITVYIYSSGGGGVPVYDSLTDFHGSIVNGAFDILLGNKSIPLSLVSNNLYYMDVEINGQDLDFNGVERKPFQAPIGNLSASYFSLDNVTGAYIDESSLGKVPNATHSDTSTLAYTATNATHSDTSTLAYTATNATHSDTSSIAYDISGTDVLSGTEIDESSLGIVPNSTHANTATTAYALSGGIPNATHADTASAIHGNTLTNGLNMVGINLTENLIQTVVNPKHVGNLSNGVGGALLNYPMGITVVGKYAYVASSGSNALEIVDISDPSNPFHIGNLSNGVGGALLGSPREVVVQGNYAYIASSGSDNLEIVDISDPSNPTHAGSLGNGVAGTKLESPSDVKVAGKYAYLVAANPLESSSYVEIIDISDPTAPSHVTAFPVTQSNNLRNFIKGNYLYVVNLVGTLEIIDISNPEQPVSVGNLSNGVGGALLSSVYGIYVSGSYAYIGDYGNNALEIVDISDPSNPSHVSSLNNSVGGALLGGVSSVFVSGKYAYLGSYTSNALEIVDISDPSNPTHAGSLSNGVGGALLDSPRTAIYVQGKYVYIGSTASNALEIIDISGIDSPAASIGVIASNNIDVSETANIAKLNVLGGITVGSSGVFSNGAIVSSENLTGDYVIANAGALTGVIANATHANTASIGYDLSCTNCISGTEIAELTDADISNTLTASILSPAATTDLGNYQLINIGGANTDFNSTGGLNLATGLGFSAGGINSVSAITFSGDPVNHRVSDNSTCMIWTGDTSTFALC